jgi:uncharacterized protein
MIVVSNTSPLLNLAIIGRLDLLRHLYGAILVPQAVYDELVVAGQGKPDASEIKALNWIETKQPANSPLVTSLKLELDDGEAEAIALATDLKADLLLLDERQGRIVAGRLGLTVVGLLGVLFEAKQKNLIARICPLMDELMQIAGFWISPRLYAHVREVAGE